ncbi:MAG TPA: hypothetical protein VGM86_31885 [Thermoanaerobaculia bacterium]|jgi:hypothetical protein
MNKQTPIAISSQLASLKLWPRDRNPDGSVKLSVRAAGYGFSGRNPSVWISRSDLAAFLRDLRELDRTRRGEARLESMSPGVLSMKISVIDGVGHTRADLTVSRWCFARQSEHPELSFGFEFDPSDLPGILKAFSSLQAPPA